MHQNKINYLLYRNIFLVFFGLLAAGFFLWYINNNVYNFFASTPTISITAAPTEKTVDLTGKAEEEFNVVLTLSDVNLLATNLRMTYDSQYLEYAKEYSDTGFIQPGDFNYDVIFEELEEVSGTEKKTAHIVLAANEDIPASIGNTRILAFKFKAVADSSVSSIDNVVQNITLDKSNSSFAGEDETGNAVFFSKPTNSIITKVTVSRNDSEPVPTATNTPIPTNTPIATATPTTVPGATNTPAPNATGTPTTVPGATNTPIATATPTTVPGATNTPAPNATATPRPGSTATPTTVPGATSTPRVTPAPTGVVNGNIALNMKLKFQGIVRQPSSSLNRLIVPVQIKGSGGYKADSVGEFVADANGVWSGYVTGFGNVPLSQNYVVRFKGPKQLAKRVCVSSPSENVGGSYSCIEGGSISFVQGQNSLDFSGIVALAGDLPPNQDGLINSQDIVFIRENLSKTDAATTARGDLNLDGIVDTQDYSLAIAALSFKYDEEL